MNRSVEIMKENLIYMNKGREEGKGKSLKQRKQHSKQRIQERHKPTRFRTDVTAVPFMLLLIRR